MRISGIQIFWILFTFEAGNMILLTIGPAVIEAKQDAWISILIAILLGILIVFVVTKVSLLYPKHSLVEFSQLILGKWLGRIVVISYLAHWYTVLGDIVVEFVDFIFAVLLYKTPPWSIILLMVLIVVYVTYIGGIEGIGRCSEVFGPIILLMLLGTLFLQIPDLKFSRIMPVFSDTGFLPIIKGTLTPIAFFGESVVLMMLLFFMDEPKKGPKKAIWAHGVTGLLIFTAAIFALMIFGPELSAKMRFPAFEAIKYISVLDFIQNIEIVVVLVWILSVFIKLSVYFFSVCYGTAQLLKIKDWRKLIWFVGIFLFVIPQIGEHPTIIVTEYFNKYWYPYVLPINMVGIPLLLWIVGSIRKRNSRKKTPNIPS